MGLMEVSESLLPRFLAAVLLWGGRGESYGVSFGLSVFTHLVQLNLDLLCFLCSWSFVTICTYHSVSLIEDCG